MPALTLSPKERARRLAAVLSVLLAAGCSSGPDAGPETPQTATSAVDVWSPLSGEYAALRYDSPGSPVWLATDRDALDLMTAAARARNEGALRELAAEGSIFSVPQGTLVTVVDPGLLSAEVRVDGRAAFVPAGDLSRP